MALKLDALTNALADLNVAIDAVIPKIGAVDPADQAKVDAVTSGLVAATQKLTGADGSVLTAPTANPTT